jgi:hypothetical protein
VADRLARLRGVPLAQLHEGGLRRIPPGKGTNIGQRQVDVGEACERNGCERADDAEKTPPDG